MENFFLTKGFQFEKYINERLLEISDEAERRALKDVIKETLIPFYYHAENSYAELEKRLLHTANIQKKKYEIITGVQHRNRIDITEEALVPMCYEDLNETLIDVYEMKECLQRGEAYTIMRIFVQLEYSQLRRLECEKRKFRAILYTHDGEYLAEIQLKKNISYLKKVQDLYRIFENNGLEWNTVCAPYLQKYFEVQIVKTDCPLDEEVLRVSIDFEEHQEDIIYDLVPMWNVRFIEQRTGAYPDLTLDRIHYEHCIYKGRFIPEREYLVANDKCKLWNVFWQDGDMHIICDEANPVNWKLMELGYDSLNKNYDMPIFRNGSANSNEGRCIHTIAEVKRYISELGYDNYLQIVDVMQVDNWKEKHSTYLLDDFIEDEIRVGGNRPYLCFGFRAIDKNNYLNQDIMSYLVSKVQWQFPEFKCVGELV